MNNFQFPYSQQQSLQAQPIQQFFPSPQGSVYSINTALDIGSVPIGSTGLSVALCLNESLMYIKSFQNGNPVIMAYRIEPFHKDKEEGSRYQKEDTYNDLIARIDALEKKIGKTAEKGGKFDDLL